MEMECGNGVSEIVSEERSGARSPECPGSATNVTGVAPVSKTHEVLDNEVQRAKPKLFRGRKPAGYTSVSLPLSRGKRSTRKRVS